MKNVSDYITEKMNEETLPMFLVCDRKSPYYNGIFFRQSEAKDNETGLSQILVVGKGETKQFPAKDLERVQNVDMGKLPVYDLDMYAMVRDIDESQTTFKGERIDRAMDLGSLAYDKATLKKLIKAGLVKEFSDGKEKIISREYHLPMGKTQYLVMNK